MKYAFCFAMTFLALACGAPRPELIDLRGSNDMTVQPAALVKTTKDLPKCDRIRRGNIVFVKELNRFQICRADSWGDVNPSQEAELGQTVIELKQFSLSEIDLCPDDAYGACFFDGGEFIRYADGSAKYTARVVRKKSSPIPNAYETMQTSDGTRANVLHSANWPSSEVVLIPSVDRGGINSGVWLRFDAEENRFQIFFDSDKNGSYSEGDEIILEPILVDFT